MQKLFVFVRMVVHRQVRHELSHCRTSQRCPPAQPEERGQRMHGVSIGLGPLFGCTRAGLGHLVQPEEKHDQVRAEQHADDSRVTPKHLAGSLQQGKKVFVQYFVTIACGCTLFFKLGVQQRHAQGNTRTVFTMPAEYCNQS